MFERLARAAAGPVTSVTVEGAEHNDLFSKADEAFFRSVRTFLNLEPEPSIPEPRWSPALKRPRQSRSSGGSIQPSRTDGGSTSGGGGSGGNWLAESGWVGGHRETLPPLPVVWH